MHVPICDYMNGLFPLHRQLVTSSSEKSHKHFSVFWWKSSCNCFRLLLQVTQTEPVDVAAHLQMMSDTFKTVGNRLKNSVSLQGSIMSIIVVIAR